MMTIGRGVVTVGLLVLVALGYRTALVSLLAWQAVDIILIRRELFLRQEEAVLRRLDEYWRRLSGKEPL